jgi:transcriptional regulator with XRE-family HTH domain
MSREALKKRIIKENQLGRRIRWAREKIKVGFRDIEKELGIPESNIRSMENGGRTTIYEDLQILADYFTKQLARKYKTVSPIFEGEQIKEVTVVWLMFGADGAKKLYEQTIEAVREDFKEREMELIERNFALDQELMKLRREIREKSNSEQE